MAYSQIIRHVAVHSVSLQVVAGVRSGACVPSSFKVQRANIGNLKVLERTVREIEPVYPEEKSGWFSPVRTVRTVGSRPERFETVCQYLNAEASRCLLCV